ncbi:MAG: glycosyltransferase family 4 protein [Lautropia sp.]
MPEATRADQRHPATATCLPAHGAPPRTLLVVVDSLHGGGAERITVNLAERFAADGWAVTLVTLSSDRNDVYPLPAGIERLALNALQPSGSLLRALATNRARVVALRRLLLARAPTLVLGAMATSAVLCCLAALGTRRAVIAWEHCDPVMSFSERKWDLLRRYAYRRAAVVVALTESGAHWIRAHTHARRAVAIPNAVTAALASPLPPIDPDSVVTPSARLLLAVGRLTRQKGFDLLLDAFAPVAARHPDWTLVILGEGEDRAALTAATAAHGLAGRVLLPGWVGNVADWYRRADAFVLSSRWEGFPGVLAEAMSHGLPAVSFDCRTGPSDMIEDGVDGLLVPPEDRAALTAALLRVIEDAPLRARLAAAAPRIAERLTPQRIHAQWQALIASLPAGG